MERGKRREPLPYNVFKMVTDFRGRRELGGILVGVYKMADGSTSFPFRSTL